MKLRKLVPFASGVALLVFCSPVAPARAQTPAAQGPARVVKLRIDNVALYDEPNGKKLREYPRGQFKDPWPVLSRSDKGFLQVQVEGGPP